MDSEPAIRCLLREVNMHANDELRVFWMDVMYGKEV